MLKGQLLYQKAKRLIPGGIQLLSKRPELFLPGQWPTYYESAKGIEITDLDGQTYLDMSIMSVGACVLGYADPDVNRAVQDSVERGSMCTLNAPEEVELAELLCELHPWAQMARYARSGGEAMSVAVRIARTHTGRDKVAFCGYHGWTDWYIAANLSRRNALDEHLMSGIEPAGVPSGLSGSALSFSYNRIDQLRTIVEEHRGELAAIVMEPQRDSYIAPGFLEEVRQLANDSGAVLIFDEITSGFRMTVGGIHLLLGIEPDLAVFAKAMANGYAMSAIIGSSRVMESAQSSFISSTNWTDRVGPSAALATIRKFRKHRVHEHLVRIGDQVIQGWRQAAETTQLPLETGGLAPLAHFSFKTEQDILFCSLFIQMMMQKGFLAFTQFKPSFAHQEHHVKSYLGALEESFRVLAEIESEKEAQDMLKGPPARRGFFRVH